MTVRKAGCFGISVASVFLCAVITIALGFLWNVVLYNLFPGTSLMNLWYAGLVSVGLSLALGLYSYFGKSK
jgi:hypothetical protein